MKNKKLLKGKGKGLSRRDFLKAGIAGAAAVGLSGLGGTKVFGAPAVKKGTKLSILQGTYFIAPGQELYKKQAQEWGQANGVTVAADFLNWPDLQPKIAASVQAGGYDIVELWPAIAAGEWLGIHIDGGVVVGQAIEFQWLGAIRVHGADGLGHASASVNILPAVIHHAPVIENHRTEFTHRAPGKLFDMGAVGVHPVKGGSHEMGRPAAEHGVLAAG